MGEGKRCIRVVSCLEWYSEPGRTGESRVRQWLSLGAGPQLPRAVGSWGEADRSCHPPSTMAPWVAGHVLFLLSLLQSQIDTYFINLHIKFSLKHL